MKIQKTIHQSILIKLMKFQIYFNLDLMKIIILLQYLKNQISNRKIDEFDSISTNFIVPLIPLADNQTIIINNFTFKGQYLFWETKRPGRRNIILLTQNFLNTNNVKTTENATSITLETNIDSESVNSEGSYLQIK